MELLTEQIKISVIIPTYKPDKNIFLECINSLVGQTLPYNKFEVIVILNGPNDPFLNLVTEVINNTKLYTKLFYSDESNVSNARNIGLQNSIGEYICFLDYDDVISENYLQNLLRKAKANTIVASNVRSFEKTIHNPLPDYIGIAFSKKSKNNLFSRRSLLSSACCKLIPSKVIDNRKFNTRIEIGEDSIFMALISDKIKSIDLADQETIYYRRIRRGSASRKKIGISKNLKNISILLVEYLKILLSDPKSYNIIFFLTRILALVKKI